MCAMNQTGKSGDDVNPDAQASMSIEAFENSVCLGCSSPESMFSVFGMPKGMVICCEKYALYLDLGDKDAAEQWLTDIQNLVMDGLNAGNVEFPLDIFYCWYFGYRDRLPCKFNTQKIGDILFKACKKDKYLWIRIQQEYKVLQRYLKWKLPHYKLISVTTIDNSDVGRKFLFSGGEYSHEKLWIGIIKKGTYAGRAYILAEDDGYPNPMNGGSTTELLPGARYDEVIDYCRERGFSLREQDGQEEYYEKLKHLGLDVQNYQSH